MLKFQYFGHLMLGKVEGRRRRDDRMRWLNGEFEKSLEVGDGQGSLACCSPWGNKGVGCD